MAFGLVSSIHCKYFMKIKRNLAFFLFLFRFNNENMQHDEFKAGIFHSVFFFVVVEKSLISITVLFSFSFLCCIFHRVDCAARRLTHSRIVKYVHIYACCRHAHSLWSIISGVSIFRTKYFCMLLFRFGMRTMRHRWGEKKARSENFCPFVKAINFRRVALSPSLFASFASIGYFWEIKTIRKRKRNNTSTSTFCRWFLLNNNPNNF